MNIIIFSFWTTSVLIALTLLSVSFSYFILSILAWFVLKRQKKEYKNNNEELTDFISLIIPFYNEEEIITDSVYSFLKQKYQKKEIILVNDGSTDDGLNKVINAFEFELTPFKKRISTDAIQKIRGYYQSKQFPELFLIDKANGGKADALNIGIECSHFEYFCSVDGDSILKLDALSKVMNIFKNHPKTIAVGSSISVVNGNEVVDGEIKKFNLPKLLIEKLQFLEYLKVFQIGRSGFEFFRSNLIVSGAFGAFKKKEVVDVGCYSQNHLGEDMDLIVKLFKKFHNKSEIRFIAEPLCMTQVPFDWNSLKRQRIRWQKGLIQSLFNDEKELIFKTNKFLTYLIVPYFILVDIFTPLAFILGHLLLLTGLLLGLFNITQVLFLMCNSILFYTLLNIISLIYRELFYPNNINEKQLFQLLFLTILESIFYRQLLSHWRLIAMFELLINKNNIWGRIIRKKI